MGKEVAAEVQVARYIHAFGWAAFWNPQAFATCDGYVPFGVFFLLTRGLDAVDEREELREVRAGQLAGLLLDGGGANRTKTERWYNDLKRGAYPERRV